MRIGVVGINHKLADLKLRETLANTCQRRFGAGASTHPTHHFVLLSTCNRTEVYFCSDDLAATHTYLLGILRHDVQEDFDQKLYSYFGQDCFHHLCRVTAGLDSAIVAETEIQGQVKHAYEAALEYTCLPSELHYLFQKALAIGKKIRADLPSKPGLPDIEHAIYCKGRQFFSSPKQISILMVGASEINEKILSYLKTKNLENISLCSRTHAHANAMCKKYQVQIAEWEILSSWHLYDWIIFGTKAPNRLITRQTLPPQNFSPKLIMDLSVPRNVDPTIGRDSGITLLNLDQIHAHLKIRKKSMIPALFKAEELVTQSATQYIQLYQQKENYRLHLMAVNA